ncbi:exodeoxyribonuclease V subunit beta [Pseudomonas sp. F1_0610]|uniref:exodeoxyribonuclease V subunit beta n=1 Tax=Pseudomonas sp. F1_0610 TaxID=3114284 RepID=UPI0039C11321
MSQPLALHFPLFGNRLIEASAGTGKTYTISALYLRLILQHGNENAFCKPLLPPQILVVTFTDAATRELRDRIRARLVEAAQAFRGLIEVKDPLLAALLAEYPIEDRSQPALLLEVAAQWMDEAAVSTIHSWCQRMLREHAFDSNSLFQQHLETDHSELLEQVVCDFWRQHCYPLQAQALTWVINNWQEPTKLLEQLYPLMRLHQQPSIQLEGSLQSRLTETTEQFELKLKELKAPWLNWCEELKQLLSQACEDKKVDGRKLKIGNVSKWLAVINHWASTDEVELSLTDSAFKRLSLEGLHDAWKDKSQALVHPALEALGKIPKQIAEQQQRIIQQALYFASGWVQQRFEQEKQIRAQMGFDDMLKRLDHALQSQNGERLAALIRQQFPVAMIDEFQDTDPLQYRIFDQIYNLELETKETGLFLIGDPKQAIYSFRGADIYTYLKAREATAHNLSSLDTNFRSTKGMVESVNSLFNYAEQNDAGKGAFYFKTAEKNALPFEPVNASGKVEQWIVNGAPAPALSLVYAQQDEPLSLNLYRKQMAQSCACEIVRLLNLGAQQQAGFAQNTELTAVKPSDIAILVRSFTEAQAIRSELAKRNVRSVYLSDKDSVFASSQAVDILLCLKACHTPNQEQPLKAALASGMFCRSLFELEQINNDELLWEEQVMSFRNYQKIWQWQGVLPMLRQLLHDYHLAQRITAQEQGERILTNILHLAELLQHASVELDGELALIRYLEQTITGQLNAGDEQILRLESDEDLVRVITIHKSKGLEYPLVFLPFICASRPVNEKKPYYFYDPVSQQHQLELVSTAEHYQLAENERLAEDLRLLYVALTRSRYACWLGLADIKSSQKKDSAFHTTAIGYLLTQGQALASSLELPQVLANVALPEITQIKPVDEVTETLFIGQTEQLQHPICRKMQRNIAENWWIASYSALKIGEKVQYQSPLAYQAPDTADAAIMLDDETLAEPIISTEQTASVSIHTFPKGPKQGTFLHGLFELAADIGFSQVQQQPELILPQIEHRLQLRDWQQWNTCVQQWLVAAMSSPLNLGDNHVSLAQLTDYQCEMEFWFAANQVDVVQLDRLVQKHVLPEFARPRLEPNRLNGMFKGFIDLTFEYQGKFYILDYKSNWLGETAESYTQLAMEKIMLDHRYDLQYVFYVLALHRQLGLRLGSQYSYEEHIGGVVYWFVRGLDEPQHGVYFTRPPHALIEALDSLFRGKTQEHNL